MSDPAAGTDATAGPTAGEPAPPGDPPDATQPVTWRRSSPPADWVERVRLAAPRLLEQLEASDPARPRLTVDPPLSVPEQPDAALRDRSPIAGDVSPRPATPIDLSGVPSPARAPAPARPASHPGTPAGPLEMTGRGATRSQHELHVPEASVRRAGGVLSVPAAPAGRAIDPPLHPPLTPRRRTPEPLGLPDAGRPRQAPPLAHAVPATRAEPWTAPPTSWAGLPPLHPVTPVAYPEPVRVTHAVDLVTPPGRARPDRGAERARHPAEAIDPWPSLPPFADELATETGRLREDDERRVRLRLEQRRV